MSEGSCGSIEVRGTIMVEVVFREVSYFDRGVVR